jgi:hypothetical protein
MEAEPFETWLDGSGGDGAEAWLALLELSHREEFSYEALWDPSRTEIAALDSGDHW